MKHLINIYLWIVGCTYLFLFFTISLLLGLIIPYEKLDPYLKSAIRLFLRIMFIKVECENVERIDQHKSYVFMPNHVSFFDAFLVFGYIPNFIRGIEVDRHFSWPIYGQFLKSFGNIPINPTNVKESLKSIREAQKFLTNGKSIVIFPEAQRTKTGQIQPFKRLPFLLAIESNADIVPVGLSGLRKVMPAGGGMISPATVKISFGDVIPTDKIKEMNSHEICKYTQERVTELWDEKYEK
jgi:1-acyl-sn-glycerol-3-phosphate acyltransferase